MTHMENRLTRLQRLGRTHQSNQAKRHRLAAEKQWVQALLQICGRKMHPYYLHRWLSKYEDDCSALRTG